MVYETIFTGESELSRTDAKLPFEVVHRYYLAKNFVGAKNVLDLGSGSGFGALILAETAQSVIGVEYSHELVNLARERCEFPNTSFVVGSYKMIPLPSASVDVVVAFDILEMAENSRLCFSEVKRVLRPSGTLITSIPGDKTRSCAGIPDEILEGDGTDKEKFAAKLGEHFGYVSIHGQKVDFGSIIASASASTQFLNIEAATGSQTVGIKAPTHIVGFASDFPLIGFETISFFTQDIEFAEPVLRRVESEQAHWAEILMEDLDRISEKVNSLQASTWINRASLTRFLARLIHARLLYALSEVSFFSARRQQRFLKSAEKRDPMLLSRKVDQFCLDYYQRVASNSIIAASRSSIDAQNGLRVTAIVPNFNHARYLPQRLDSILSQTYPLIDILILDDCSKDDSHAVIEAYVKRFPGRIRAVYNAENSGSVFRQWQKGHSLAKGDLVWICESDDFCEPTFVEGMINEFRDPSVMIAFGQIQFANSQGECLAGMDHYREDSESGIWTTRVTRPAAEWFRGGFGVKNLIANVGGSLWRRFEISDQVWQEAINYKIMGDWYLYSAIVGGGQIAYVPSSVSYFRVHDSNTSGSIAQAKPEYFKEYARLMTSLKERWDIPDATLKRFIKVCRAVSESAGLRTEEFQKIVDYQRLSSVPRKHIHVLVGILNFSFGGGEIFPIHLANALLRKGIMVSILQMNDAGDHPDVRRMLAPGIPVYTADTVRDIGIGTFIENAGISVVHSHIAHVEALLLDRRGISVAFISTLHGSYEAMNVSRSKISRWSKKIDKFAYTTDRNLRPFDNLKIGEEKFVKIKNAMPVDEVAFPKSRTQLGVEEDAVVFSLVARGVEGKGWVEAVRAYRLLRERRPDVPMALLMVGEGPATVDAKRLASTDGSIHFLGFVKEIYGLYRISDVALIPTRFPGESYPLCLIQALQVGVPCVSTDVGEIKAMSQVDGQQAGIIIDNDSDNNRFVNVLSAAMERILEKDVRDGFREKAQLLGATYDIDVLADEYLDHYRAVLASK